MKCIRKWFKRLNKNNGSKINWLNKNNTTLGI